MTGWPWSASCMISAATPPFVPITKRSKELLLLVRFQRLYADDAPMKLRNRPGDNCSSRRRGNYFRPLLARMTTVLASP